jgi:glutathione synthase/RimK-type ligase-like ATP-grasp enzyme
MVPGTPSITHGTVGKRASRDAVIGLVTYSKQPVLTDDDRPLIGALAEIGLEAEPVQWDDASVDWREYDALVLRSTWDYHLRVSEFERWLSLLDRERVPLWNPTGVVRWNMHKGYLQGLQQAGILIPSTRWLPRGRAVALGGLLAGATWTEAIVKPAISASATKTSLVHIDSPADAERFAALLGEGDVLVQEVVPEVARDGEWSLMFIGASYSHAVLKKPRPGDFRVQQELGGTADPATAPSVVIAAAERVAAQIPGRWLYARIDGVVTERGFMLMEAECIEPLLFFEYASGAYERFASALQALIAGK